MCKVDQALRIQETTPHLHFPKQPRFQIVLRARPIGIMNDDLVIQTAKYALALGCVFSADDLHHRNAPLCDDHLVTVLCFSNQLW